MNIKIMNTALIYKLHGKEGTFVSETLDSRLAKFATGIYMEHERDD